MTAEHDPGLDVNGAPVADRDTLIEELERVKRALAIAERDVTDLRRTVASQLGECSGCVEEPEETCPLHGRPLAEWLDRADRLQGRVNAVLAWCDDEDARSKGPSPTTIAVRALAEGRAGVTHQSPRPFEGITGCCGRTPFELPRLDRLTEDGETVTCRGGA